MSSHKIAKEKITHQVKPKRTGKVFTSKQIEREELQDSSITGSLYGGSVADSRDK